MTRDDLLQMFDGWVFRLPATPEKITALEKELGLVVPHDLRSLLSVSDGLDIQYSYLPPGCPPQMALWGIEQIRHDTAAIRANWVNDTQDMSLAPNAKDYLVVASEGSGDLFAYCLKDPGGEFSLVLLRHETGDVDRLEGYGLPDLLNDLAAVELEARDELC